ncbi:hypothetical protein [Cytobacillus sp. IB215316]|uniref:hypothetical protein n=1 Tax=Cytobacillus sp. IB215316 TaxID=3097354 RepID=UPI002A1253AD|nr:hypothetical protein [Cytobacillus sp. IB215316]MDX8361707.1 hypothetical protein [Cytobacillus sp. IB215316]
MKIKNIEFPTALEKVKDIEDDNIDVFVELEDGMTYTLVVATPKNLFTQMDQEQINYIPASPPFIIVRTLNEDIIKSALQTYVNENAYWLKQYFLASEFDMDVMDQMLDNIRYKK